MSNKEYVKGMINFLREREDMDSEELLEQFSEAYCLSKDDAKQMILELVSLQIFCEKFGVTI